MISLKQWMETVDYRITEGSDYYSGGRTLFVLDSWNGKHDDGLSSSVVYDTKTQEVISVSVFDYAKNCAYRLTNDKTEKADNQAWDDVTFTDLEDDDDFLDKAYRIMNNLPYDTRVSIPIDLPDNVMFSLMRTAHERDITFNQLVSEILEEEIAKALSEES